MANQNCVPGPHNNEVMNSKQSDRRPVLIKNDVIGGIDRSDRAVGGISLFVVLKIIGYCPPASDIVPIKARFDDQHSVGLREHPLFGNGPLHLSAHELSEARLAEGRMVAGDVQDRFPFALAAPHDPSLPK